MKNIITIQHTQSIHHTNGMVGSWTDWELSDLGKEQAECIGKKLSIFNAMWLGMDVEMLNSCDLFGMAGGVSFMIENPEGKHIIKRLSDLSYKE